MLKPDLNWLKQYLNFSRKDRNAILTLAILIFLILIGHILVNNIQSDSNLDLTKVEQTLTQWERIQEQELNLKSFFYFDPNTILSEKLDSLSIPENVKRNIIRYRESGGRFQNRIDLRKIYGMNDSIFGTIKDYIIISVEDNIKQQPIQKRKSKQEKSFNGYFDPNKADINLLKDFGFSNYQANNLLKYRENGGVFNTASDLLKIYGVDTTFFLSIKNNIRIEKQKQKNESVNLAKISVEINSADSAQLVKLRGIGPTFSSRIIKFRELLGGFYSKRQLLEVYNFPEETYDDVKNNISVDSTLLTKIRINFADYKELIRHPYLKKEKVASIIELREKNGAFDSLNQIFETGLFERAEFDKIKPYLTCR